MNSIIQERYLPLYRLLVGVDGRFGGHTLQRYDAYNEFRYGKRDGRMRCRKNVLKATNGRLPRVLEDSTRLVEI